jgi:hypothetical protein
MAKLKMNRNLFPVMLAATMGFGQLAGPAATAQATQLDSLAQYIRLSPDQLKAFQGFYQSPQNKDMVVQIDPTEHGIRAKLLWNNGEIKLLPESESGFVSKEGGDEGPIHLVFHRDSSGAVNAVNVANNGVWNRVKDYKPVVKKEMEHTPAQLTPFQGLYELQEDNSRILQFSVRENSLELEQMWDGTKILFVPESELSFFTRSMPLFSLDFSKDKDGNITRVLAFKRDVWIKTNKLAITPAILKSYEGKYRSKDDPDNEIRIIARDSNLVVRQLWDKKDNVVQALTATYFNDQTRSFPLVIAKDQEGKVSQVVLLGNVFIRVPE